MLFWRVEPLDQILATAEKKALKRQLGAFQLTMLGIGAIIGTGIFVLTAEAGQKAGPAMMLAFVIAAVVCGLAALAYAELASMVPVSGSAYTYTYGVLGEGLAWATGLVADCYYRMVDSLDALGDRDRATSMLVKHLDLRGPGCRSIYSLGQVRKKGQALRQARATKSRG